MTAASETFDVQLAIYDLSRGMARSLSAQFLGSQFAVDIIPHTAIVVYGREYFFGGGIQSEEPYEFRRNTGMSPVQTLSLGRTTISKAEFEHWCSTMMSSGGRYQANAYDLLTRNCNNFSHDAATQGLRLPKGVPEWIMAVPQRFVSSPMGQMVLPLLQNMQLASPVPGAVPMSSTVASFNQYPSVSTATNPWVTLPSTTAGSTKKDDRTKPLSSHPNTKERKNASSILDTFSKPLLSSDTTTATLCIKKLLVTMPDDDGQDRVTLETASATLTSRGKKWLDAESADDVCGVLFRCLQSSSSSLSNVSATTTSTTTTTTSATRTLALMLLRVVILWSPPTANGTNSNTTACWEWLQQQLQEEEDESSQPSRPLDSKLFPAARSMAWLCAANAVATTAQPVAACLVDMAVRDLARDDSRPELRQAASALLYNAVLKAAATVLNGVDEEQDELSDFCVTMLVAALEGLVAEPDATVRLRRLAIVGRIVRPLPTTTNSRSSGNPLACSLVQDLGLVDSLRDVVTTSGAMPGGEDDEKCQTLAFEILQVLENSSPRS
jgi:hypothetical protein